jgi:hypothetical protein
VVNPSTSHGLGRAGAGQTITFTYRVQVDAVEPGTKLCINTTASFGGGPLLNVQACTRVNCPEVAPGLSFPATSEASDQKAGSVLVYNVYASSPSLPNAQNAAISITNIHPAESTFVHLFFVDGSTCSVADSSICLTPNQTIRFLTSDLDPGTTGYLIAVAVNGIGCPVSFNYLIGDEYVKFASGHAANLQAEAISALAGGLPLCDERSLTAELAFDNISYNALPRVLAVDGIPDRALGNDTLLVNQSCEWESSPGNEPDWVNLRPIVQCRRAES